VLLVQAFEAFHGLGDSRAVLCLKYMILSKIMTGNVRCQCRGGMGLVVWVWSTSDVARAVAFACRRRMCRPSSMANKGFSTLAKRCVVGPLMLA